MDSQVTTKYFDLFHNENYFICIDSLILRRNVVQHITFQYTFNTSGLVTDDTLLQTIENEISENNIDDLTVRDK